MLQYVPRDLKPLGAMLLALHAAAALLEPAGVDRRAVVRVISAAAVASIHGLPVKAAGLPRAVRLDQCHRCACAHVLCS